MSEMFDENSERRRYFHESFSSYNLPSTEARDSSSLKTKVKEENNLNGKPESPKTISTLKKNSGDEEALPFTSGNLAPSNCTSENKTIELNKIIEPKQTSSKSSYTYEMPVNWMMLDNVYQNQSMDKPDKPFFPHIDYSEDWSFKNPQNLNSSPNINKYIITNFTTYINDIKESPCSDYLNINNLNIGKWNDDDDYSPSILSNDERSTCKKFINNIQFFDNSFFCSNPIALKINDDDERLSIQSEISLMNVRNNINGVKVNPITNSDHIPYLLDENKTIAISIELNEEIENRNIILEQILNISKDTDILKKSSQREFGDQMKHVGILVSNSMNHINKFLNTYPRLAEYALYFENNALSFLDKRIINLKKRIFDYAYQLINITIEKNEYRFVWIDYEASKVVKASFNQCLLNSKLSKIFLDYQDKKFSLNKDNSEIINYIEENKDRENKAHYLLSMKLKDFIMNVFNQDEKNGLELYLNEVKQLLSKIKFTKDGEKIGEDLIEKKLEAIYEIDKTLSENIEEYFNSKNERKTKEVKVNNIGKNYKNMENKKNKKKKN